MKITGLEIRYNYGKGVEYPWRKKAQTALMIEDETSEGNKDRLLNSKSEDGDGTVSTIGDGTTKLKIK